MRKYTHLRFRDCERDWIDIESEEESSEVPIRYCLRSACDLEVEQAQGRRLSGRTGELVVRLMRVWWNGRHARLRVL